MDYKEMFEAFGPLLLTMIKVFWPLLLVGILVRIVREIHIRYKNGEQQVESNKKTTEEEALWRNFEKQIAGVFRMKWYDIVLGQGFNDWWKDIVVRKNGQISLIQCKHWRGSRQVGVKEIREFYGAVSLYNKKHNKTANGIFITTGKATDYAVDEAQKLWILLRDETNYIQQLVSF